METQRLIIFSVVLPTVAAFQIASLLTLHSFALRVLSVSAVAKLVSCLYNIANVSMVVRRVSILCFASVLLWLRFASEHGWLCEDEYLLILIRLTLTYFVTYIWWQHFPQDMLTSLQLT